MRRINVWISVGAICLLAAYPVIAAEKLYDVCDYSAKHDGYSKAIDALSPDTGKMIQLTDVKKVFIRDKQNN